MSRIEEALKRAGLAGSLPEPAGAAQAAPLDAFASGHESNGNGSPPPLRQARAPEPQGRLAEPRHTVDAHKADTSFAERLVVHENVGPVSIEQYRRLAAVLHHAQAERGVKVVMVASAQVGEGKTLTAANLALTLSESYRRRVLLIDADLRRPTQAVLFGSSNSRGLTEHLKTAATQPLPVVELSDFLSLLPAGKAESDPMAGLTSARMQQTISDATTRFEWVVIDTPPVALLPDANLMAAMADAIILVIAAGRTPAALVLRAIDLLGRDRLLGTVLNRVETGALADAQHYESYRYYSDRSIGRFSANRQDAGPLIISPPSPADDLELNRVDP